MINSKEAQEQTVKSIETKYTAELENIQNMIQTAVDSGEYSTEIEYTELNDVIQNYLITQKGYSLSIHYKERSRDGVEDPYVVLSWKEPSIC